VDVTDAKISATVVVNKSSDDGKANIDTDKERNVLDVSEDHENNLE